MADEDICEKAEDKKHVPDWTTVHINHDGGEAYVDISCKLCGKSGCVGSSKTLAKNICW